MSGRHGASRRARRKVKRRKVRARRLTASSSAALLAVAGLGTIDKVPFGPDLDSHAEPITDEFAVVPSALADGTTSRAEQTWLSRSSVRDGPYPIIEVSLDTGADKPRATAPLPADSGSGRRVVYDISGQQVWLVESDGSVARTYLVSGSRYDQLDPGTYTVFSASRHAVSWTGSETMEYMVRFHRGRNSNIGFHDIPVKSATGHEVQTLSELGTPLSDGCIRQDHEDAKALFDFAPEGTTVVVVRS
jgi:lipoprotein-anchoring transpeptidase ErfK/SrfK